MYNYMIIVMFYKFGTILIIPTSFTLIVLLYTSMLTFNNVSS